MINSDASDILGDTSLGMSLDTSSSSRITQTRCLEPWGSSSISTSSRLIIRSRVAKDLPRRWHASSFVTRCFTVITPDTSAATSL